MNDYESMTVEQLEEENQRLMNQRTEISNEQKRLNVVLEEKRKKQRLEDLDREREQLADTEESIEV